MSNFNSPEGQRTERVEDSMAEEKEGVKEETKKERMGVVLESPARKVLKEVESKLKEVNTPQELQDAQLEPKLDDIKVLCVEGGLVADYTLMRARVLYKKFQLLKAEEVIPRGSTIAIDDVVKLLEGNRDLTPLSHLQLLAEVLTMRVEHAKDRGELEAARSDEKSITELKKYIAERKEKIDAAKRKFELQK